MAKLNKLITYAYLTEETDLPSNIPNEDFEHKIYEAQEMLRADIGDEFYQDFLTNFKNNTLSTAYKSVFPYIKQFVAWQTYEFWIAKANFNPTRSGMRVHTEENSVVASDIQMATLIKQAKLKSEYYKNLLIGYLKNHNADYPLFQKCCTQPKGGFQVSVVRNKHGRSDIYGTRGGCYKCCE